MTGQEVYQDFEKIQKRGAVIGLSFLVFMVCIIAIVICFDRPRYTVTYEKPVTDSFLVEVKPFPSEVHILISEDTTIARRYASKYFTNVDSMFLDANTQALTLSAPGSPVVVWMRYPKDDIALHEFSHVVYAVLSYSLVPHTDDTDEVYAYELGYIFKQYKDHINKDLTIYFWRTK